MMREYWWLLTLGMWEWYSVFVDGGSLSPEWNDNSRTQSGIQTNNILGYNLYQDYARKVIAKPTQSVLTSMHTSSGATGWGQKANTNRILYTPFNNANTFTTSLPVGVST